MATTKPMSRYDRVRSNLTEITKALMSTPGARKNLTRYYKQHGWLDVMEDPEEDKLLTIALVRIKQDPTQFDLFLKMLKGTGGMDLIVIELIRDIAPPTTSSLSTSSPFHTPPPKRIKVDQSCLSPHSSNVLPLSFTSVSQSLATTSLVLPRYADYLRAVYNTCPVAKSDKFPPTPSKVFIKLALVKKTNVSRAQADKFTRLTLQGDIDQILQVKEPIEMDDILKVDDMARLVVVEGAPGIGKSTLAWELCRQWPALESLKRFSLVVLHRLREEEVQLATDVTELFPCGDDPGLSSLVAQEVKGENGSGVLFVFDGFDEFPSELREKSLVMDIISGSKYLPKATVLVTSRPSASAQLQALLQTGIGKHVEVVGFSEKEIFEFAHSVFGDTNLFTDFNTYLAANPVMKGMMYNPLNCAIIVGVYQDTYELGKPVPHTQTQLYTELTLCLLFRYLSATGDPLAKELPDELGDLPHYLYQQLMKIGELAFNGKRNEEVIFKQLPEGCSDLGLLVKHTALYTRKETTTYNFFHLTLQEYISAFYISQLPADGQRALFKDPISMDVVWRFVAGRTKMQKIGWDEFMRVEGEENIEYWVEDDAVSVGPFLLQCLYEGQDVQSCESVFGRYRVEFDLGFGFTSNYGLYALGYCISACSNTWNVTALGIPSEGLEMLGYGLKSVDYGGGTIEKLELPGSEGIMSEGGHLLQTPHLVLRHIKSLILQGCNMDQRGYENLAECIPFLHSLTSLDISDNPGGDGSLVKLFLALRKHGKLQTLCMYGIKQIGLGDVAALADLIQPSSTLRELGVGIPQSPDVHLGDIVKLLVRTVLSHSSLNTVRIKGCKYPLDGIDTIGVNISSLTFYHPPDSELDTCVNPMTAYHNRVKVGTNLSHILRENISLKELTLNIPLDRDEVYCIIDSMKDNDSLEKLELSEKLHSQYLSETEGKASDHRVTFSTFEDLY